MRTQFFLPAVLVSVTCSLCTENTLVAQEDYAQQAKQILEGAGFTGGIIVHLGCGDGMLTTALRADKNYIVHGLDTDARTVQAGREYVRKRGIYGPVSIEHFDGKSLPYADNLVNLVVTDNAAGVPKGEIMRALAPEGVLYARQDGR